MYNWVTAAQHVSGVETEISTRIYIDNHVDVTVNFGMKNVITLFLHLLIMVKVVTLHTVDDQLCILLKVIFSLLHVPTAAL